MSDANQHWRDTGIAHWQADCARCGSELSERLQADGTITWVDALSQPMWLCSECGNKRCPKATWHENTCTGSNAPGQQGSSYQTPVFHDGLTVAERAAKFFDEATDS